MKMTWFLFQTKTNRERWAEDNVLRQEGFKTLLPEFYDPRKCKAAILWPTYLFVGSKTGAWTPILSTRGIARVITGTEGRPSPVPKNVIKELKAAHRKDDGLIHLEPKRNYRFNQRVKATEGGFAGLFGLYQHQDEHGRLLVLFNLLGRNVTVPMQDHQLSAA